MDSLQKRLKVVRRLRRALPVIAVMMLAGVVGQIGWREFRFVSARPPGIEEGLVQMINPAFNGEGSDGKRYRVTAKSGVRNADDPSIITLDSPAVTIRESDGETARTVAERGVFSEDALTLTLEGNVQTEDGGATRLLADNTVIDTRTGGISGRGFEATRGFGVVRADNYTITDSGDRVLLKGGVRARINGQ
jgi:lipopolysaccharide export system protein LptC